MWSEHCIECVYSNQYSTNSKMKVETRKLWSVLFDIFISQSIEDTQTLYISWCHVNEWYMSMMSSQLIRWYSDNISWLFFFGKIISHDLRKIQRLIYLYQISKKKISKYLFSNYPILMEHMNKDRLMSNRNTNECMHV